MSSMFTGVKVLQTTKEEIDNTYKENKISLDKFDGRLHLKDNQNQYVVLNDKVFDENGEETFGGSASIITRVGGEYLHRVGLDRKDMISGVCARNKEQIMALDALLDPSIGVVTLTGSAGTGKTLLTLSAALHLIDRQEYDKIILTRPMTQVGKHPIGILPGEVDEKFGPYLKNYMCNFEHLLGRRKSIDDLIAFYQMEFIPFSLIRGASWPNTIIIADEMQNADGHEILTLGTRVGDASKLIIMGDLNQRDEKINREKTGMFQWINHHKVRSSTMTASVHLIKCERSATAALFSEVFEEK